MQAGLAVPARMERPVEWQPMLRDADRSDLVLALSISWSHRYAVQMVFRSVYFSIACGERSRPKPDWPKPPNGVAMDERSNAFTHTVPPRSALDMRCATFMFEVHTAAARP